MIRQNTVSCKDVYEQECDFDKGKDWCENCAEIYEGESQNILDELNGCGVEVEDIYECNYIYDNYNHRRDWWVQYSGKFEKKPDLEIIPLNCIYKLIK